MQRFILIATLLALLFFNESLAQKRQNIWYFGNQAGIDFNSSPPRPLLDSRMNMFEGSATMCDPKTGALLFYTDGATIWNSRHAPMPNGTGLNGGASSSQSSLIVPLPGSSTIYYLFTSSQSGGDPDYAAINGLQYSVIDMTLEEGLGDVTLKNAPLMRPGTEKLAGIPHCNGIDFWIISVKWQSDEFHAYRLTSKGLSTQPVISSLGFTLAPPMHPIGWLQPSHNGRSIAMATWATDNNANRLDLYDFDASSGTLSNHMSIPADGGIYGACFSPDNRKLYVSQFTGGAILQYDVYLADEQSIAESRIRVNKESDQDNLGAMQLGPDGRIYVAVAYSSALGVIERPNATGINCGYTAKGFLLNGPASGIGLVNFVYGDDGTAQSFPASLSDDTIICSGGSARLFAAGGVSYQWSPTEGLSCADCDSPIARPTATTTYTVRILNQKACLSVLSVTVGVDSSQIAAAGDTVVCLGDSARLSVSGALSYSWSPADGLSCSDCADPVAGPLRTTVYTVTAESANGCLLSDSVVVTVLPAPTIDISSDVVICLGDSANLSATGDGAYAWSPAQGLSCVDCPKPVARPDRTTIYTVVVTGAGGCQSRASTTVTVTPPPTVDAGADVAICRGEDTRLFVSGADSYSWDPASGLSCSDCSDPTASPTASTVYIVTGSTASGCIGRDTVVVTVNPIPIADAGRDTAICPDGIAFLTATGGPSVQWTPTEGLACPDCHRTEARPAVTTDYIATVTGPDGCTARDTVRVVVNKMGAAVIRIARNHRVTPGTPITLPIMLEGTPEALNARQIDLTLRYDARILRLVGINLLTTLLNGWTPQNEVNDLRTGTYTVRLNAPVGGSLQGNGVLLLARFNGFIGSVDSSEIGVTLSIPESGCGTIETHTGLIRLDSICGLSFRLIQANTENFALNQNHPNPFNPTTDIAFSIGLDGPARLEIFDATGRTVATLVDETLRPGRYEVTWNATAYPSGIYYYRLTAGTWSRTNVMMLVK